MRRVLSGMRPTGALHLGHLCGVLNNWKTLQDEADCYFFVADWHALTTEYAAPRALRELGREIVISWLAAGIDPQKSVLFVQSDVKEHAELHLLLSMVCPLSWLMQLPTYKEQKENLNKDIDTYGFLGYPLLQSADIMAYRADTVPVGEDQLPHIEFTREVARRVNHFYGGGAKHRQRLESALQKIPESLRQRIGKDIAAHREKGDAQALDDCLREIAGCELSARERATLRGHCLHDAEEILVAPAPLLTRTPKLLGTDGRKMSKSYDNTLEIFDAPDVANKKIMQMQTDPARQRRTDKGTPEKCPVWNLHEEFSGDSDKEWAYQGCTSAGIGCVYCKKKLRANIDDALAPLIARRREIERENTVEDILADGASRARACARDTLESLRDAMGVGAQ